MEDIMIIEMLEQRNELGLNALNKKYGTNLIHLSDAILQDEDYAKECVNDAILRAWNTIPPEHPQYLYAYVAKICRFYSLNKIDWLNAKKRSAQIIELTSELEQCIPGVSGEPGSSEEGIGAAISQFLRTQSPDKRNIFIRRYWFSDSVLEISEKFGISQSKVRTSLFRLRKQLRQYLEERGISI